MLACHCFLGKGGGEIFGNYSGPFREAAHSLCTSILRLTCTCTLYKQKNIVWGRWGILYVNRCDYAHLFILQKTRFYFWKNANCWEEVANLLNFLGEHVHEPPLKATCMFYSHLVAPGNYSLTFLHTPLKVSTWSTFTRCQIHTPQRALTAEWVRVIPLYLAYYKYVN